MFLSIKKVNLLFILLFAKKSMNFSPSYCYVLLTSAICSMLCSIISSMHRLLYWQPEMSLGSYFFWSQIWAMLAKSEPKLCRHVCQITLVIASILVKSFFSLGSHFLFIWSQIWARLVKCLTKLCSLISQIIINCKHFNNNLFSCL